MARPDVFDSLDALGGMQGEQAQADFQSAPLPYETPAMTQGRVNQQNTQTRQYGRMKAEDLASRGIPYDTSGRGNVSEITDSTGAPLTNADKANKIAYDSAGKPVDYSQRDPATGKRVVKDAYADVPDWTEPTTGNIYRRRTGLPWLQTGTDPAVAQQAQQAQVDKVNAQTNTALAPIESAAKSQVVQSAKDVKSSAAAAKAALQAQGLPIDPTKTDPDTARKQIEDAYNTEYGSKEANATPFWGGGTRTPEAEALRKDIDARKAASMAILDQHQQVISQAQTAQSQLDQVRGTRQQLAQDRLDAVNQKRIAAGMEPVGSVGQDQKQQSIPDSVDEASADSVQKAGLDLDRSVEVTRQNLAAASSGAKTYTFDKDSGTVGFDPKAPYDSLKQAVKDGVMDADWAKEHEDKFKDVQDKYQALEKSAGNAQVAKALAHGVGLGGAFMLGAGPGAAGGGALGALTGPAAPIASPVLAALGGLATGTLAAFAAKKGIEKLGEYSAAVKSMNDAAELHPVADSVGQLAAFGTAAPKAISNLLKLGNIAGGGLEAAKAIGLQLGKGAAGGLAFELAARPAFDAARYIAADQMGIPHDKFESPDAKSLLTNTALGVLLAGHSIEFKDYSARDVASILLRSKARREAGVAADAEMSVPDTVDAFKSLGVDLDSQAAEAMRKPLSPQEQSMFDAMAKKTQQMEAAGVKGVNFEGGQQALVPSLKPGSRTPISSAVITEKPPEATPPASPEPLQLPPAPNEQAISPQPPPEQSPVEAPPQSVAGNAETSGVAPQTHVEPAPIPPEEELAQREQQLATIDPKDPMRPLIVGRIDMLKSLIAENATAGPQAEPQAPPVAGQPPAVIADQGQAPALAETPQPTGATGEVGPAGEVAPPQTSPASEPHPVPSAPSQPPSTIQPISEAAPPAEQEQSSPLHAENTPQKATSKGASVETRSSPKATAQPVATQEPSAPASTKPTDVLHEARNVKLTTPKGARFLRVTDAKGRQIVEPIENVTKGANVFHQAGPFKKVESGVMDSKKQFVPLRGEITALDANKPAGTTPERAPKSEGGGQVASSSSQPIKQTPEVQHVEKLAKAALALYKDSLAVLGHPQAFETGPVRAGSGIETDVASQRIRIDPEKMAQATAKMTPAQRAEWVKRSVAQEVIHVGTLKYAAESPENLEKLLALNGDKDLMERAGKVYGPEWEDQSDFAKAAEAARMLLEGPEKLTEASYKFLKDFLDWMKDKLKNLSRDAREVLDGIRQKLGTYEAEKAAQETKENAPPRESRSDRQAKAAGFKDAADETEFNRRLDAADKKYAATVFKSGDIAEKPATPAEIRAEIERLKAEGDKEGIVPGLERYLAKKEQPLAAAKPEDQGPFYSQLTRTVQSLPQETMTVAQVKAAISKGAKPDEIKASGIFDDPLSPLYGKGPNDKVTKREMEGYAVDRQTQVKDVTLGEPAPIFVVNNKTGERIPVASVKEGGDYIAQHRTTGLGGEFSIVQTAITPITHFEEYQLPGADPGSYREQFVTWPEKETRSDTLERLKKEYETANENYIRFNEKNSSGPLTDEISANRRKVFEVADKAQRAYEKEYYNNEGNWSDGHAAYDDVKNPVVRIRRNIRTDANGKKTYFIEEMQGPQKSEQEKMPTEVRKRIYEIGMKRAIRDAVDSGADAIGWTTGDEQVKRYEDSIVKHFDKVEVRKVPDSDRVTVYGSKDNQSVLTHQTTVKGLEDVIGKELAAKAENDLKTSNSAVYSGLDLKVGGSGLRALYDKMLPSIANKLAEKVGGKVGVKRLKTGETDLPQEEKPYIDTDDIHEDIAKHAIREGQNRNDETLEELGRSIADAVDTEEDSQPYVDDLMAYLDKPYPLKKEPQLSSIQSMDIPEKWKQEAPQFALYAATPTPEGPAPEGPSGAQPSAAQPNPPESGETLATNEGTLAQRNEKLMAEAEAAGLNPSLETIKGLIKGDAATVEKVRQMIRDKTGKEAINAATPESLGASNPMKSMRDTYDSLADSLVARATKKEIAYKQDAVGTLANYHGQQAGDSIRLDLPEKADREAMPFVIEAGGDKRKIQQMDQKIVASKDPNLAKKYGPIIDHAYDNLDRLNAARANHDKMMAESVRDLKANGIDIGEVENYVTRKLDAPDAVKDVLPNPLFGASGAAGGSPKYFAKGRTFETLADAIKAGYPPISTDLADLDAHRIEAAKKIIHQKQLFEELRRTPSPTDGKPIIGEMEQVKKLNGKTEAQIPRGYSVVQAGGQPLVIHNDFAGLFRNLFGSSGLRQNAAGRAAIKAAALVKHGTLAVDTFHIGRMLFKMATAGGGGPFTVRNGHLAWNIHKGRALLEYSDADLGRAESMGDITKKEADYARANRPKVEKLIKSGMNVGKVADNLMEQAKMHLPIVSTLNSWIFGKLSRSAMLQASLVNLDRNLKNPHYTEAQAYRQTAKEMNELFGNLQNQGLLQNKTLQDISRLIFLAPNWTESQFRNEARAYGQAAMAPINAARGKGVRVGNSARAFAAGLVALLAANQVVNYLTRGKSTFENPEKDHKLDAWIPGGKRGFWFNPLEIAGEYAHAAIKYLAQHENPVDVATHIASNKLSPMARAAKEGLTGRDYAGRHFLSNADRARAAITDALPIPMFTQPFLEKDPRSPTGFRETRTPAAGEKQFLQSVGAKVTAAQSPRSQMFAIAQPFRADRQQSDIAGEYTQLRQALDNSDEKSAKSEIKWLYDQGKTPEQIKRAVGISSTGEIKPEHFAGSQEREDEMLRALKPDERKIYAAAQRDHLQNAILLQKVLPSVPLPRVAPKAAPAARQPFAFR